MQQQIWAGKSPCFAGMMSSKLVRQRSAWLLHKETKTQSFSLHWMTTLILVFSRLPAWYFDQSHEDAVVTLRAVNFASSVSLFVAPVHPLCPAYNWTQNWKHRVQMNWISVLVFINLDYWMYINMSNSNMNWLINLFKLNARNDDFKRLMKNLDKC